MAIYLVVLKINFSMLEKHVKKIPLTWIEYIIKYSILLMPLCSSSFAHKIILMLTGSKVYFGTNKQTCRWGELCK
jgi:hypothetical protein